MGHQFIECSNSWCRKFEKRLNFRWSKVFVVENILSVKSLVTIPSHFLSFFYYRMFHYELWVLNKKRPRPWLPIFSFFSFLFCFVFAVFGFRSRVLQSKLTKTQNQTHVIKMERGWVRLVPEFRSSTATLSVQIMLQWIGAYCLITKETSEQTLLDVFPSSKRK